MDDEVQDSQAGIRGVVGPWPIVFPITRHIIHDRMQQNAPKECTSTDCIKGMKAIFVYGIGHFFDECRFCFYAASDKPETIFCRYACFNVASHDRVPRTGKTIAIVSTLTGNVAKGWNAKRANGVRICFSASLITVRRRHLYRRFARLSGDGVAVTKSYSPVCARNPPLSIES